MIAASVVAVLRRSWRAGRRGRRCRRRRRRPRRPACRPSPREAALVPCAEDGIRQTSRCVVAAGAVVAADREQAGELALRAGVGLQRHRVVAGDLGQPAPRARRSARGSPAACSAGANGCRSANSGQVIGSISAVALSFIVHEPERDHRAVEREVAVGEPAQVAQHRGLGAVRVEHRVGRGTSSVAQQRRRAARPSAAASSVVDVAVDAERRPARAATCARVVVSSQAIADVVGVDQAQVDAARRAAAATTSAARPGHADGDGVEERVVHAPRRRRRAAPAASARGVAGATRCGDRAQPVGAVVDGVHAGDHREQHLRGADVAGRLLAADVLLAGLQREAVGRARRRRRPTRRRAGRAACARGPSRTAR